MLGSGQQQQPSRVVMCCLGLLSFAVMGSGSKRAARATLCCAFRQGTVAVPYASAQLLPTACSPFPDHPLPPQRSTVLLQASAPCVAQWATWAPLRLCGAYSGTSRSTDGRLLSFSARSWAGGGDQPRHWRHRGKRLYAPTGWRAAAASCVPSARFIPCSQH